MPLRLTLLLIVSLCAAAASAQSPNLQTVTPAPSTEPLLNPGMGLYLQYPPLDAKPDEWFMRLCDIAYYRLDWSDVNPEKGVYTFDEYFGPRLDFWVKQQGKRVAFRVMCQNMHSGKEYVTPRWVFDEGVPGVKHVALNGKTQTDPAFWDDRYLALQAEFVRKLGEYLGDKPGLEFVDIGSIGEWGEMHLARWSPQDLAATGYTHTRYVTAYRRMIDEYARAFPHTRVFLNVGGPDNQTINDYAALRGCHFRQDGLNPAGASYDVGEWLYKPYSRRGVICNFEFHSGYDDMVKKNWDVKQTLEKGLSAPISYLNTNLFGGGGYRKATPEVEELLRDAARRIGYRFVITKLQCPTALRLSPRYPTRVPIEVTWTNSGIAPCYQSHALRWRLLGADDKPVAEEVEFPRVPTTMWMPGEDQVDTLVLRVPTGLPQGRYRLTVGMFTPETNRAIMLGMEGRRAEGDYELTTLPTEEAPALQGDVFFEDFEQATRPWNAPAGLTATLATDNAHSGDKSLAVAGSITNSWNYAGYRVPAPVTPFALYRLTGWMLVEKLEPLRQAPFLKLGVNAADGKWITNLTSNHYDTTKPGTWQKLEAVGEMPANSASVDIAIEKGDNSTPVTVNLRVDDLKLELVEGI